MSRIVLKTQQIELKDIKELVTDKVYYSVSTTWWTVSMDDLYRHPKNGLPCDSRGCMLLTGDPAKFIAGAEDNVKKYGKHGINAFITAYHGNIILQGKGWPTCLDNWEEVNRLLDEGYIEGGSDD